MNYKEITELIAKIHLNEETDTWEIGENYPFVYDRYEAAYNAVVGMCNQPEYNEDGTINPMIFDEEKIAKKEKLSETKEISMINVIKNINDSCDKSDEVPEVTAIVPVNVNKPEQPIKTVKAELYNGQMQKYNREDQKRRKYSTAIEVAQIFALKTYAKVYNETLYVYDGKGYTAPGDKEAESLIVDVCREYIDEHGTPGFVKEIYKYLLMEPKIKIREEMINDNLILFDNYILNIKTGKMDARSPQLFVTHKLMCNYETTMNCPKFDAFVYQLAKGDMGIIERIWEMIGYCLVPDVSAKSLFVLYGMHDTGKSLLANIIEKFFEESDVSTFDVLDLSREFAKAAFLDRKLCISPDIPDGVLDEKAVSILKGLTGGDRVNARRLYQQQVDFRNKAKIICVSNNPLKLKHNDEAFVRRVVGIPCYNQVPRHLINVNLIDEILQEKDAIATKAIQYYFRLKDNNYKFSGIVSNDFPQEVGIKSDNDIYNTICCFIMSATCKNVRNCIFVSDAYELFIRNYGMYHKISYDTFSIMFSRGVKQIYGDNTLTGIKKTKREKIKGTGKTSCYVGLAIK